MRGKRKYINFRWINVHHCHSTDVSLITSLIFAAWKCKSNSIFFFFHSSWVFHAYAIILLYLTFYVFSKFYSCSLTFSERKCQTGVLGTLRMRRSCCGGSLPHSGIGVPWTTVNHHRPSRQMVLSDFSATHCIFQVSCMQCAKSTHLCWFYALSTPKIIYALIALTILSISFFNSRFRL